MAQPLSPLAIGVVAGYFVLGLVYALFVDWLPGGNKAKRFVILYPIMMASFLLVVRTMWGELPLFVVLMVVAVAVANALQIRFCANCGAVRFQRSIFSTRSGCRKCGRDEVVPVWKALNGPGQSGAV